MDNGAGEPHGRPASRAG